MQMVGFRENWQKWIGAEHWCAAGQGHQRDWQRQGYAQRNECLASGRKITVCLRSDHNAVSELRMDRRHVRVRVGDRASSASDFIPPQVCFDPSSTAIHTIRGTILRLI